MSRWIDAEWVRDLYAEFEQYEGRDDWTTPIANVLAVIDDAPSLDLVRCEECRHKRLYDGETKYYYCALEDRPNRQWSVDDWNYCYWGERKENE